MAEQKQVVPKPGTLSQNLSLAFCIAFGLILIAQVQVAGDGMWFWYAVLLNSGKHLYSGMHLPLQPLYPLLIAWTMRLFGPGWIVSKLPAVILMTAYALALRLIVRALPGNDPQRAIALALGFSMPLLFEASRFDDYHVLTDTFTAFSVVLLIALAGRMAASRAATAAAALGVLSGLAMVSRLNDGAILALSVGVCLLFIDRQRRWTHTLLFSLVTALVVVGMVLLTGDSLHDWATNSIVRAAGAKGGAGRVIGYPVRLAGNAVQQWFQNRGFGLLELYTAAISALSVSLLATERSTSPGWRRSPWARSGLVALAILIFVPLVRHWGWAELPTAVADLAVLAAFGFAIAALVRAFRSLAPRKRGLAWNPLCLLVLLPLGQLLSGSMSSGGSFLPLTSPVGLFLVVLPIGFPELFRQPPRRIAYTTMLAAMAFCCFSYKWQRPFHWHSYDARPLFTGREVYHHPVYGPMVIETGLLRLVQPVCQAAARQPNGDLLSLPFPYPNYFCAIPPWHHYVQSFFDISTSQTVQQIMTDLETAPPAVVVYQRQIKNLEAHEQLYNFGKPLPHRALDELIGRKLQSGTWTAIGQQCRSYSDWITIRTAPATLPSPHPQDSVNWNPYRCDKPDER